jgi:hypothetical protein
LQIAEATDFDDDPIQDFSSSPLKCSRRAPKRRNVANMGKKQKPLNELQHNIDLSKYKLPNAYGMSPKAKKRLKVSMTCSDGFEGRESQPTWRTMSMRLPRHHRQILVQTFARVPELTFTSSRESTENIGGSRRLQGEQFQPNAITISHREDSDIVTEALAPLMQQLPGSLEDRNKPPRTDGISELEQLTKIIVLYNGDNVDTQEIRMVEAAPTICRPKRRVAFSEDVEVLQALRAVSAPIAMTSHCDSDDSENSTTGDESDDEAADDQTSSGQSDGDRSEGDAESISDSQHGSDKGNSDAEIEVEAEVALQPSTASANATSQSFGHTQEYLKESEQAKARNSQRPSLNEDFVRHNSVYNAGINQKSCSPIPEYPQSLIERGKVLITGESRKQRKITEDDPWRPRRPVSTRRLIEVDDDILDYPSSPTELSRGGDERGLFHSASPRQFQMQSYDDRASSEFMGDLQERTESQSYIELEDPDWPAPYGHEDGRSYSRAPNSRYPPGEFHRYVVEVYPTYLARALDSFSNPSQGGFSLARSKSMPSNHRFHYMAEQIREDPIAGRLEINPAFKHTVSSLKRPLSQMQSTDLRALTKGMSIEAGTTPARGQAQPLPFIPPFLKD